MPGLRKGQWDESRDESGDGRSLPGGIALLGALAAALGVFARGDGAFVTVTSARGEVYDMATTASMPGAASSWLPKGVGWDVFTLW